MLTPFDLMFSLDLTRIPKQLLQSLLIDAGQPSDGTVAELAVRLWSIADANPQNRRTYLLNALPSVFAGRTSVFWLTSDDSIQIADTDTLIERFGFNPSEKPVVPDPHEVGTAPKLIGITRLEDGRVLARFVVKTRVGRRVAGYGIATDETLGLISVVINSQEGYVEVRGERRASNQTIRAIQHLLPGGQRLHRVLVLDRFGGSIERLADALGGKLVEAVSKPDAIAENLTEDQLNAVISILRSIGEYLVTEDLAVLEETLETARETLAATDQDFAGVPFVAVVLAGMQRLNLAAVDQDLRMQPLYSFLGPVLQHQGCYIKFPVEDEGDEEYTIRVGVQINTISFHTPATENAIRKVRQVMLGT